MKPSIQQKLEVLAERYQELAALLADPDVIGQQNKFRQYSKEYAQLEPIVVSFQGHQTVSDTAQSAKEMLDDQDEEIRFLAAEELEQAQKKLLSLEEELQLLLLPTDPNDDCNTFLEIRAGTGGDEAAIFVGNLYRMYTRYAEKFRWKIEVIKESPSEQGGYKEIILRIEGQAVYAHLKFESGVHRVQRVPATESQGRIHTSACTVAVLVEQEKTEHIDINPADLRVDTYRSSGAGGQHVNTTDSAVRLTHIPTGIVVECQDERSQHKNRARAMSLLQAKILSEQQAKEQQELAETRRNLVGSGDRSERIRTYNYPQGRVTDHRINLTLYKLSEIMQGALGEVIEPLRQEYQADQLAMLNEAES